VVVNEQLVPESEDHVYVLANYQEPPAEIHGHPGNEGSLQQRSPAANPGTVTELQTTNDRKYLVQKWGEGDICVETTGKKRNVEVQVRTSLLYRHH
jgi:hypothetical protein